MPPINRAILNDVEFKLIALGNDEAGTSSDKKYFEPPTITHQPSQQE